MKKYTLITDMVALSRLQKAGKNISRRDCLMLACLGGKIFTKDEFFDQMSQQLKNHGFEAKTSMWISMAWYCWKKAGAIHPVAM